MDLIVKSKIDFAFKLLKSNKEEGLNYIKSIFEEYKYKISDIDKYNLLKSIIYNEGNLFKYKDFENYIKKALILGLKLEKVDDVIKFYKLYCKYLYRIGEFKKCALLSEEVLLKLNNKLQNNDVLIFKELQILSENNINFVRRIADQRQDLIDIIIQENDVLQLVETFIYYNLKFLFNENVLEIINSIKQLRSSLKNNFKKYIKNNKVRAELNNFLGIVYLFFGLYNHAKRHFLLALREGILASDKDNIIKYNNNIALVYAELGHIEKAMNYFSIIEKMYATIKDERELNQSYAALTLLYLRKKRFSLVKAISFKTLKRKKELGDYTSLIFMLTKYISITYYEKFEFSIDYYNELKKIFKNVNNTFYKLYENVFEKIYEKKETLKDILYNLVTRNFYPLSLIFPLSLIIDIYKDIKPNPFFKLIIDDFYKRLNLEFRQMNALDRFFKNHIELKPFYNYLMEITDFRESKILKENDKKKLLSLINKVNKLKSEKGKIKEEFHNFSNDEIIMYLFLKIKRKGEIIFENSAVNFNLDCFYGKNAFQKELYLRYNIKKINYVEKKI